MFLLTRTRPLLSFQISKINSVLPIRQALTINARRVATNTPKPNRRFSTAILDQVYRPAASRFQTLPRNSKLGLALGAGTVLLGGALLLFPREPDPILDRANPADKKYLAQVSTGTLLNGWLVYAFVSQPLLIEWSESLFYFFHSLPLVSLVADSVVRHTFFRHFLAGETTAEAEEVAWAPLRSNGIGTLCGYNLEARHDGSTVPASVLKAQIDETLHAIKAIGTFGIQHTAPSDVAAGDTRCWVRIKLTGLTSDPEVIERASTQILDARTGPQTHFPGVPQDGDAEALYSAKLSQDDLAALHKLNNDLKAIMTQGQRYGVRIIVDAEQTWYQPAIDVFTEQLMREFNTGHGPPIVCASFQAYLRRNTDLIKSQLDRAHAGGYKLIFKQVRGAYHPYENARWASRGLGGPAPVWSTKAETDASYHRGMAVGLGAIKSRLDDSEKNADVAAIWATHNEISVDEGVKLIQELGLGVPDDNGSLVLSDDAANRVAFAQLFGMKDNLTNRIVATLKAENGLPVVCKSVSYGDFEQAIPFLSRRALENKTVMEGRGGAVSERRRIGRELLRRYVPFYDYE